jgi:hypothetical protein
VTAIEAVGLRTAFGQVEALDGLDLSVPRGAHIEYLRLPRAGTTAAGGHDHSAVPMDDR